MWQLQSKLNGDLFLSFYAMMRLFLINIKEYYYCRKTRGTQIID